jgi:hypothetical protein
MKTIDDLINELFREIKQKEFIELETKRCEVRLLDNFYCFMGFRFPKKDKFKMEFTLTNDHIEREECCDIRYAYKPYKINLNFNLN